VVDGDTIWLQGEKIRIADINTPEVSKPDCTAERALGERATSRLIVLLNAGGFSLKSIDRDEDRFGRKLRVVTRGGESLGTTLVSEGLAEEWTGSRRSWC
jgi:micrococcal nuclease